MGKFEYPCPICGQYQKTREAEEVGKPCADHPKEREAFEEKALTEKDPDYQALVEAEEKAHGKKAKTEKA